MKVKYNDVIYTVVDKKDGRVYMKDQEGNEKDIAESTFEKAEQIEEKKELTAEEKKKDQEKYMNQKVPFKAMLDGDKYSDDITVTINGKNWVIERGKRVMIPRYVYNALEAHERQRAVAAHTSSKYNNRYKDKEKVFV